MAFVDELDIEAKAGDGGDGVVRWLHLKSAEFSGPSGGNGGDGGDIYIRAVSDMNFLSRYRSAKKFAAENGHPGEGRGMDGKRGADLFVDIPRGSIIINNNTGEKFELLKEGETLLILRGGRGGAGNMVFKSSTNRSPDKSLPGSRGEEATLHIELHLIADAGLVGLPNAGKTTLLNELTGTSAKVGDYAFTTLEPNLGALFGFTLADIPGLIEHASEGKGLGSKFLRHISRTRILIHCVSLESKNPILDYETVRGELSQWGGGLQNKPEIIVLTKSDRRDIEEIKKISDEFKTFNREILVVSIIDESSISSLRSTILSRLKELPA